MIFILFPLILPLHFAAAQTGGTYDLSHNVVASGGGSNSTGGAFTIDGTVGQNIAGTTSAGGAFNLRGGFWAFLALQPTAATVNLSGRVFSGKGAGIVRRVRVRLLDTFTGIQKTVQTNGFGYYRFEELEVGHFYIIKAESQNFMFTPEIYTFELFEDREGVDFIGERVSPGNNLKGEQ